MSNSKQQNDFPLTIQDAKMHMDKFAETGQIAHLNMLNLILANQLKVTHEKQPQLRAVNMGLVPTMNSLDDVLALAKSKLPITCPNELTTILFVYHNTLLKEVQHEQETTRPD